MTHDMQCHYSYPCSPSGAHLWGKPEITPPPPTPTPLFIAPSRPIPTRERRTLTREIPTNNPPPHPRTRSHFWYEILLLRGRASSYQDTPDMKNLSALVTNLESLTPSSIFYVYLMLNKAQRLSLFFSKEKKPLGRLCKMCSPFFHESRVIQPENRFE
jgi:hypothetical protein